MAQAAREAKISIIEMMEYVIETGYNSTYTVADFKKARNSLKPFLKESHKKPKKRFKR